MKLLIVDDNELNREMACDVATDLGVKAILADSGSACLNILKSERPDVVLMDYMMPEMDGAEATVKLHEMEGLSELPVIAMTAEEEPSVIKILLEAGMCAVLHKPVDPTALYKTLSEYTREELKAPKVAQFIDIMEDENLMAMADLGFDVNAGIRYTGSLKNYRQYALNFTRLLPETLGQLDLLLKEKDYEDFVISIHGLKSNFRALGEDLLFKQSLKIEELGKEGKTAEMCDAFESSRADYEKCASGLNDIYGNTTLQAPLPLKELKGALRELKDAMKTFDLDTADAISEDLMRHEAPKNLAADFEKLYRDVAGLKYEAVIETAENILRLCEDNNDDK